jgi:hypothetical protein
MAIGTGIGMLVAGLASAGGTAVAARSASSASRRASDVQSRADAEAMAFER